MVDRAAVLVDPGLVDAEALLREVADHRRDAVAALPALDELLEPLPRALAHEHEDLALAVAQQLLHEVAADEARGPGDEIAHRVLLPGGRQAYTPAPAPPRPSPPAKRAAPATASAKTVGAGLRLQREPVGERQAEALERGAAVGEHRLLREAREALGHLQRALEVLAGGHDLGHQAHRQRLVGVDDPAGEDQVQRAAHPDDARQALRAAVDERHAPAALGEAERRALGGDPQVAPQRELEAAGQAPAADRGDRRLGRREAGEAQRARRDRRGARRRSRSP